MHKFLLRFNNIADADAALLAAGYATFEDVNEQPVEYAVPYDITIGGEVVSNTKRMTFLASELKALTLPHTYVEDVPLVINGQTVATSMDFVVDNLQTYKRRRENWLGFTVNGHRYEVPDDGGKMLIPAADVTLYDFEAQGWPLMNVRAVYDQDGNQTTAPQAIPGVHIVMCLQGEAYETDVRSDPADETLWETSNLANDFKVNGTERTYTATETDWGVGYSFTYYEKTIGGVPFGLIAPADLPDEIRMQHGVLR